MSAQPLSQIATMCQQGLPEGWTIFRRESDGAVIIRQPGAKVPHPTKPDLMVGPDYSESRIDSEKDADVRLKGGKVWYDALLRKAEKVSK